MDLAAMITGGLGATASVLTLIILSIRGVFSIEKRLTKLETQVEPFWDGLRQLVAGALASYRPAENPMPSERWDYLVAKMRNNTLNLEEALELNNAMVEKQEEARRKNDNSTLIILGIGLALLAVVLVGHRDS